MLRKPLLCVRLCMSARKCVCSFSHPLHTNILRIQAVPCNLRRGNEIKQQIFCSIVKRKCNLPLTMTYGRLELSHELEWHPSPNNSRARGLISIS